MTDFAAQVGGLITESFKDGEASDGSPTAEEVAAAAANAPKPAADDGEGDGDGEGDDGEAPEGGEGDDGQEGDGQAPPADEGDKAAPADANKGKGGKSFKERIGDMTANWRSAQRETEAERARAERAEAELAALKSGKAPLTPPETPDTAVAVPPDPSKFDYGELDPKYIAALARFETGQALAAHAAETEKTRQTQAAAAKQQERGQKQDALVKAGVALHDDFDEVVMQGAREGKWALTPDLGLLLLDSEFGASIIYDLAKDPDEAARVAGLSPTEQAKWLGRQEAKLEAAKPSQASKTPKPPQAPPPPKTPRGGSGSNKVGSDSTDFAAVEEAWKGGQFK